MNTLTSFKQLLVLVSLVCFAAAGCDGHDCPEGAPEFVSATLNTDTVAAGGDIEITVVLANFELSSHDDHDHGGSADCAGGHYHVYLDDLLTNPIAMPETAAATLTIPEETEAGPHTLIVRLHNRDHTIVEPQVITELSIQVE